MDDDTDVTKWRTVWIITIVILICEVTEFLKQWIYNHLVFVQVIQFFLFAKGEPQSWNNQEKASKQGKDWFLVSSIFLLPTNNDLHGSTYNFVRSSSQWGSH